MDKFLKSFDKFSDLTLGKLVASKYTGFYFLIVIIAYTAVVVAATKLT